MAILFTLKLKLWTGKEWNLPLVKVYGKLLFFRKFFVLGYQMTQIWVLWSHLCHNRVRGILRSHSLQTILPNRGTTASSSQSISESRGWGGIRLGARRQEVIWWIGLAHGVMDSLITSIWGCWYLSKRTKIQIFKSLVILVLLYGCESWTLNTNLKWRIDVFCTKCLCRIMGYCWYDCVKSPIVPWDWFEADYQHSPSTPTLLCIALRL